jgi:hypothetical protein
MPAQTSAASAQTNAAAVEKLLPPRHLLLQPENAAADISITADEKLLQRGHLPMSPRPLLQQRRHRAVTADVRSCGCADYRQHNPDVMPARPREGCCGPDLATTNRRCCCSDHYRYCQMKRLPPKTTVAAAVKRDLLPRGLPTVTKRRLLPPGRSAARPKDQHRGHQPAIIDRKADAAWKISAATAETKLVPAQTTANTARASANTIRRAVAADCPAKLRLTRSFIVKRQQGRLM